MDYARTVGIAVDTRRKDKSEERKAENVQRLKDYKARLVVYSKKNPNAEQVAQFRGVILPIQKAPLKTVSRAITEAEKKRDVFLEMRRMRGYADDYGSRAKRKEAKAKEAEMAVGKGKGKEGAEGGDE